MHVARTGFTPLKGARHQTHASVTLTPEGPAGDRAFCLVDPAAGRCLRTVENPTLLQTTAAWDGTVLSTVLPTGDVTDEPVRTGELRDVDYWGRRTVVELVDGPWSAAFSDHLDREVLLARTRPGEVVYGEPVTLVTSSSLQRLADLVDSPVDDARFRATLLLETGELDPHAEDRWGGRRLLVGSAELQVHGAVPRCAVVDLDPVTGVPDLDLLKALADDRGGRAGIFFGVYAEVTVAGMVRTGDVATLV